MFTIYGYSTFNGIKVLLTAEELGADYEYIHVDLAKGENRKDAFLQKHPFGKIPVLEHQGQTFIESNNICRYLARCHDNQLYAADPAAAAQIDGMVDLLAQHIGRGLGTHYWEEVICEKWLKKPANQALLAEAKEQLDKQLPYLEQCLAERPFLTGENLTIADTIALAYFQTQEQTSVDLSPYPSLQRWYQTMNERPAAQRVRAHFAK